MINRIFPVAENCQRIRIDDYVRQARISLKEAIVEARLAINGYSIKLCNSKACFGGVRLWFECPECHKKKGILYRDKITTKVICRKCLNSSYQKYG